MCDGLRGLPQIGLPTDAMPMSETSSLYFTSHGKAAMMDWYARCLARLPFACDSLALRTRHGETHALACGQLGAPPVVLLHGTEGTALSWRRQMEALRERFRVFSVDVVGANGRSTAARLPWNGRGYGEWLADVLDSLELESAAFAGISNGSWHIFQLALHAPSRVTRAVLLSANGLVPVRMPFRLARFEAVRRVQRRVIGPLVTRGLLRRAVGRTSSDGAAPDEDEVESLYLLTRHYRFRYPPGPLTDEELRALHAPTLLLMGERDPFYAVDAAVTRASRTLPNLQSVEVLPGAGHGLLADRPDEVNARMLAFLGE